MFIKSNDIKTEKKDWLSSYRLTIDDYKNIAHQKIILEEDSHLQANILNDFGCFIYLLRKKDNRDLVKIAEESRISIKTLLFLERGALRFVEVKNLLPDLNAAFSFPPGRLEKVLIDIILENIHDESTKSRFLHNFSNLGWLAAINLFKN